MVEILVFGKNAGSGERRAELRRSARRQQFIIKVSSWPFYNQQEEVVNQKSLRVIDRFVFNDLDVDNAGQTVDNKHTGSMISPFFLLSKTDKPLDLSVKKGENDGLLAGVPSLSLSRAPLAQIYPSHSPLTPATQPIFLLITPTFFRFTDVTSNVYIKKGKKKELLYRQESCYDLLFIDYCYFLFWKGLLISFYSKSDVENDIEIAMMLLLFDDKKFIIESKFLIRLCIAGEKKENEIKYRTGLSWKALKTGWT